MRRFPIFVICLFFFAACSSENVEHPQKEDNKNKISKKEEATIKTSASGVLFSIAQARGFVASKDLKEAQKELQKIKQELERITDTLPTAILRSQIYAAQKRLSYDTAEEIRSDMFPIYSTLDEIGDLVYVENTKKYLKEAEKNLIDDDKEAAHNNFSKASQTLIYTEIDAPVSWSIEHIKKADKQLAAKNFAKADYELKTALEGVQILAIGAYDPLAKAKGSYWRALKFYSENKYEDTSKELLKAKDNLKKIIKPNKKTQDIILKLNVQIDELAKKASSNTEIVK